jgi:integrase
MDLQSKINQANGRLKSANLGVAIQQINNRLYIRATLHPKPESIKNKPYQQRISLGIYANGAGLQNAEKEARKLGDAIAFGLFDWSDYLNDHNEENLVKDLIKNFEKDYFNRRPRNEQSEETFKNDYLAYFKQLEPESELTESSILKIILKYNSDTRSRQKSVIVFNLFAKFAGLNIDLNKYKGEYNKHKLKPRNLPSDDLIIEVFNGINNPQWRWVFGMLATYGLRPHEVFNIDINSDFPVIEVLKGKTKDRKIWALPPQWVSLFDLPNIKMPNCSGSNSDLGHRVAVAFKRLKIPFKPYDLRHKWAIRAIELGLDVSLAAQQMGHSVRVHCDVYQRWLDDDVHQKAYDLIVNRNLK